jgi:hypothetical protein
MNMIVELQPSLRLRLSGYAKSKSVNSSRFGCASSFVNCELTGIVQKHEAAAKAAEAAIIEESMLSKENLSQAQADFEKY